MCIVRRTPFPLLINSTYKFEDLHQIKLKAAITHLSELMKIARVKCWCTVLLTNVEEKTHLLVIVGMHSKTNLSSTTNL
jgi:hypothetical protein